MTILQSFMKEREIQSLIRSRLSRSQSIWCESTLQSIARFTGLCFIVTTCRYLLFVDFLFLKQSKVKDLLIIHVFFKCALLLYHHNPGHNILFNAFLFVSRSIDLMKTILANRRHCKLKIPPFPSNYSSKREEIFVILATISTLKKMSKPFIIGCRSDWYICNFVRQCASGNGR